MAKGVAGSVHRGLDEQVAIDLAHAPPLAVHRVGHRQGGALLAALGERDGQLAGLLEQLDVVLGVVGETDRGRGVGIVRDLRQLGDQRPAACERIGVRAVDETRRAGIDRGRQTIAGR